MIKSLEARIIQKPRLLKTILVPFIFLAKNSTNFFSIRKSTNNIRKLQNYKLQKFEKRYSEPITTKKTDKVKS